MKRFVVLSIPMLFVQFSCSGDDGPEFVDPDAPPTIGVCNPKAQTGCSAGEKCTWINDQDNPPIGHVGCAPDGTVAVGTACTEGPAGPMGYDNCAKGSVCLAGVCKQICDLDAGEPMCDQNHSCTRYADFLEVGGAAVAGVCDPACDPLTQDLKVGDRAACGSADATMPSSGCYGFDEFSCAPTGMMSWGLTDLQAPRTNASGNPYLNGCAPGFIPLFYERTGSTKTLCSGYCAAQEVTNQTPNAMNAVKGNAAAVGKLPTSVKDVGDATCLQGKKGGNPNSECIFFWPYLEDNAGELNPIFEQSPLLDTLGVCFNRPQFLYDSDGDMSPDAIIPSCASLPPRSAQTPGNNDDATDWGCMKRSNSMAAAAPNALTDRKPSTNAFRQQDVRLPKDAPMELIRHRLK